MHNIKIKKTGASHGHIATFYHEETGDPIMIAHKKQGSSFIDAQWHPAMKHIYGEKKLGSFALLQNISSTKLETMKQRVLNNYVKLSSSNEMIDPLDTEFVSKDKNNVQKYKVFSEEGDHVGDMDVAGHYAKISAKSDNFSWESHFKKYGENLMPYPYETLDQFKSWLKSSKTKPSFVGSHQYDNVKVFNTHLPDAEAANKYADHLLENETFSTKHGKPTKEKINNSNYRVVGLLPYNAAMFNGYQQVEHNIRVKNGVLRHTKTINGNQASLLKERNLKEVIE